MLTKVKYTTHDLDINGNIPWTREENNVWKALFHRQIDVVKERACKEYVLGLKKLDLPKDRIPQPYEVTKVLQETTGWSIEPVSAVIPAKDFFTLLANKKFPAASFIRTMEDIDYLKEPDIFHEVFAGLLL